MLREWDRLRLYAALVAFTTVRNGARHLAAASAEMPLDGGVSKVSTPEAKLRWAGGVPLRSVSSAFASNTRTFRLAMLLCLLISVRHVGPANGGGLTTSTYHNAILYWIYICNKGPRWWALTLTLPNPTHPKLKLLKLRSLPMDSFVNINIPLYL